VSFEQSSTNTVKTAFSVQTERNVYFLTMCYYRPWLDAVMCENLIDLAKHCVKELFWTEYLRVCIL